MCTVLAKMMDIVDSQTRSRMMSTIRGRDTRPEMLLRSGLQRLGLRHRLGDSYRWKGKLLPGRPDLVYPRYRAVIQANGCFWHRHNCHLFRWPGTRRDFWRQKLEENARRDARNIVKLEQMGWRVLTVWECSLKGKTRREMEEVLNTAANWVQFDCGSASIEGIDLQSAQ
jgi:DNA mismatch endonuclease (patch repair protein)